MSGGLSQGAAKRVEQVTKAFECAGIAGDGTGYKYCYAGCKYAMNTKKCGSNTRKCKAQKGKEVFMGSTVCERGW